MKYLSILLCFALASCGRYADGTSVYAGGLFLIPLALIAGTGIFGYLAYKAHKSNSTRTDQAGNVTDNTGNVPYTQIGYFWFAVICFLALIAAVWMINGDK